MSLLRKVLFLWCPTAKTFSKEYLTLKSVWVKIVFSAIFACTYYSAWEKKASRYCHYLCEKHLKQYKEYTSGSGDEVSTNELASALETLKLSRTLKGKLYYIMVDTNICVRKKKKHIYCVRIMFMNQTFC